MKNGVVKIVACVSIGAAITALCLTDPSIGIIALISGI